MTDTPPNSHMTPDIVLVTGPSGAGRSTAINALEDLGFEIIDNLPLSLLPRVLDGPLTQPLALGLDVRNRDFSTDTVIALVDRLQDSHGDTAQLLYLEADDDTLVRRYSETRRRHPLSPAGPPLDGIRREAELLAPLRARADVLIETTVLTPHDLKAEIARHFATGEGQRLSVSVQSFSFKRGLPRGVDFVFDCRFLRNPYWDPDLRPLDGRDEPVATYVKEDPICGAFLGQIQELLKLALPAQEREGKAHVAVALGCTGGRHRSVALTETLAAHLAQDGWPVSKRHRELERGDAQRPGLVKGQVG